MNPPTGVVTFLFTDIEGSTRRWEADADAMRKALAAHDEVLRNAIEVHGGRLFKHTGDGVIAAFASPGSAVDAAVAAQRALELPVRMGIATGEAQLKGEDYFGVVLNRAARVMGAGHGGQILLADSTAKHITNVDLIDLGPRRLRDVSTPVEISQVRADGLGVKFPPLKVLDVTPGNLRPAATSFIGREPEVADVVTVLRGHRLVTLTGMGGVGKTRLSLEVAEHLANEFPDGVWLFELAAVTDPGAVPDAVAGVLGITQQPGKSLIDSVAAALEGRVRLLVFDNCEHVLDAAAGLIEAILAQSSTVKILATSREGLRVAGEQLWQVPSLDVAGSDSAAVRLFVERASAVSPRMSLAHASEATAVVEICNRLDGIPLAIELAASRMASMTASEVRDRLDQRFRLLVGSRRAPARHQTLRHAVQWSYEQLDDAEKDLLERISVFSAGFDLQGACAVAGSDDYTTLDLLDALVRKSLLVADLSAGRTRYSMLETIRLFAGEQLVTSGGETTARDAHARHFAQLETTIVALWDSPRQREAYEWFTIELANLRSAFRWVSNRGDLAAAVAIVTGTFFLGYGIDNYEPVAWAEELLEPAHAVSHPRLAFLYAMASQCWLPGRIDDAVRYGDAGQLLIGSVGDELPFGAEGLLSTPYMNSGQLERAIDWCRTNLTRGRDTHALTRSFLIFTFMVAGSEDEAMATGDGLIEAAEASRNPYTLTFALLAFGFAFRRTDPLRSRNALQRGLKMARDTANRSTESQLAICLATLEAKSVDPTAAFDYVALAIRNLHDSGNTTTVCSPLAILSTVLDRLGHHEPAATIAGFAINPFTTAAVPELTTSIVHLREVLGDSAYEALAYAGEAMSNAEMVAYAYAQIDEARAEVPAA
ncbi:MAG TPA: adenylate/guanylate cyclase domain-containing protein [Mycobacterium sp.]|nr:adenylate/guanylate cyclase domain-containing protein [Mycobacterium sp.]